MFSPAKNRLFNILLADDGSLNARAAAQLLTDLPHDQGSDITALRVFTPIQGSEYADVEAESVQLKNLLKSRHLRFHMELLMGYPSEKIAEYAREHAPDLIVMGAKGSGMFSGVLGSVAMNIVHEGRWPVLIVHQPYKGLKRVLLVIDGSAASQYTCDYLAAFPLPAETDIEVLHVVPAVHSTYLVEPTGLALPVFTPEDEQRLRLENEARGREVLEHVRNRLEKNGIKAGTVLRVGNPGEQILNYVKDAGIDLIVCGSRGAGNLTGWLLGSVSRDLVHHATCSVLVVRGPAEAK